MMHGLVTKSRPKVTHGTPPGGGPAPGLWKGGALPLSGRVSIGPAGSAPRGGGAGLHRPHPRPTSELLKLMEISGLEGLDYQTRLSNLVSMCKGNIYPLNSPPGATWTIGGLGDTIYRDKKQEVDGWGEFYLSEIVNMLVVGEVEGTAYPCDQLVLMTCEDRNLYAYDGEELHVVASSLEELCSKGIQYPATKSYYFGEPFENMTQKDWDKVKNSDVGKSLDEAHDKLVTAQKDKFLAAL